MSDGTFRGSDFEHKKYHAIVAANEFRKAREMAVEATALAFPKGCCVSVRHKGKNVFSAVFHVGDNPDRIACKIDGRFYDFAIEEVQRV